MIVLVVRMITKRVIGNEPTTNIEYGRTATQVPENLTMVCNHTFFFLRNAGSGNLTNTASMRSISTRRCNLSLMLALLSTLLQADISQGGVRCGTMCGGYAHSVCDPPCVCSFYEDVFYGTCITGTLNHTGRRYSLNPRG